MIVAKLCHIEFDVKPDSQLYGYANKGVELNKKTQKYDHHNMTICEDLDHAASVLAKQVHGVVKQTFKEDYNPEDFGFKFKWTEVKNDQFFPEPERHSNWYELKNYPKEK